MKTARLQFWYGLWVVLTFAALWQFQGSNSGGAPATVLQLMLLAAWVLPLPLALVALYGLMGYKTRETPEHLPAPLSFRIVTRGDNVQAVRRSVAEIYRVMRYVRTPPPWVVEVVTDKPTGIPGEIVVPATFRTAAGAKWKARALEYALRVSRIPDSAWILHLDEESTVDRATVHGIARFMREHPGRIGQGAILYNRELATNPWLTLADSLRTGDDIGRFYAQYRAGNCQFGMHGSFVLIPNRVEKAVGFDFPPELCVTEDAYFAMKAATLGYKFGWVDGFVFEQSPRSVRDFLKQRRRWFIGIRQVILAPLPLRVKGVLAASTLSWAGAVLVGLATIANLIWAVSVPGWVRFGSDLSLALYVGLYLAGLHLNLKGLPLSRLRRVSYYALLVASIPLYAVLETLGVVYAILKPQLGFEVIQKN